MSESWVVPSRTAIEWATATFHTNLSEQRAATAHDWWYRGWSSCHPHAMCAGLLDTIGPAKWEGRCDHWISAAMAKEVQERVGAMIEKGAFILILFFNGGEVFSFDQRVELGWNLYLDLICACINLKLMKPKIACSSWFSCFIFSSKLTILSTIV